MSETSQTIIALTTAAVVGAVTIWVGLKTSRPKKAINQDWDDRLKEQLQLMRMEEAERRRALARDAVIFGIAALCLAAWFQHVYTCFTEKLWGFLIAGAIFFPIAVVHGFGIWLGLWH